MGQLEKGSQNMKRGAFLTIFLIGVGFVFAEPEAETVERDGKVFPIFQVVRFPNTVCVGTTQNGTCYTAEECSSKGGVNDGSCASGFGVCCKFEEACGSSKSENNTILTQAAVTTLASPCTYMVCPCSSNICRIRYDFTSFTIAGQVAGTSAEPGSKTNADSIGACREDTFSITSVGGMGSPVICGTNTGYHMVLDQTQGSTECQQAMFTIGGTTTTSRSWTIKVTQYACGDEDNGGPPGCLQWYTEASGNVASFGWQTDGSATAITAKKTHLQAQAYQACFRREKGKCLICYVPSIVQSTAATATASDAFGISIGGSTTTASKGGVGTQCADDYFEIPNAQTLTIASATTVIGGANRVCGRFFASTATATASVSICSRTYPFRLGVHFDNKEVYTTGTETQETTETDGFPGGILGFSLNFKQMTVNQQSSPRYLLGKKI